MRSDVSTAGADQDRGHRVEELERELAEANRREAATAEVLRVISKSPSDVQPVFDVIVASAARLCGATFSAVARFDGDLLHLVAVNKMSPEETAAYHSLFPRPALRNFIIGRAFTDGVPVHVEDIETDPDYDPHTLAVLRAAAPYRSYLGIPILRDGVPIGAIGCGRREVKPFTEAEIALVQTFADQAVIAIENARLFEAEQASRRELTEALEQQTATSEVLSVISSSPGELEPVFQTMLRSAVRICEAKFGNLWLREGDSFRIAATHGAPPAYRDYFKREPVVDPDPRSGLGQIVRTKQTIHIEDISVAPAYKDKMRVATIELAKARSLVAVPMLKENEVVGCIAIYRQEVRPFTDKQVELLTSFAAQAVIAIENARLLNELRESLQQQTATAEVLKVISRSAFDLHTVLTELIRSAATLCEADFGHIRQRVGELYPVAASFGLTPEQHALFAAYPTSSTRGSVPGRAILDRCIVHFPDVLEDPEFTFQDLAKSVGFRASIGVPLISNGEIVGVLTLNRLTARAFSEKQIALIETFADQAVIAIENTRLFEEVQQKNTALTESNAQLSESLAQQTATSEILAVIGSSPTGLQPVFNTIARNAKQLLNAHTAGLTMVVDDELQIAAFTGLDESSDEVLKRSPPTLKSSPFLAKTIRERVPYFVSDTETDNDIGVEARNRARNRGFRSILAVPLVQRGASVGAIHISRRQPGVFTNEEISLVKTFADQAVIAIENTRLFEAEQASKRELQESLEYQTATAEVLSVISRSPNDVKPVFDTIARIAQRLCQAEHAFVLQREQEGYRLVAANDALPDWVSAIKATPLLPDRGSLTGRVAIERRTVHVDDLRADPEYKLGPTIQHGVRSELGVPLIRDGEVIGVIIVGRTEVRPFTDRQIALIETFAEQAVIAIENTRLFEEVQARTADLSESLDQQTATSEILGVISSSPTDVQPVFDTIARNAVRLCAATYAMVFRFDGAMMHLSAHHNVAPEGLKVLGRQWPMQLDPRSVPARAVLERRVIHVHDVLAEADNPYLVTSTSLGIRTMLIVPMMRDGQPIGAVAVYRQEVEPFSDQQIALVETFASQAVIAVENVRLFSELDERNRDLTALGEVGRAVSSTLDLKAVLKTIVDRAVALSGTDGGSIFYYREGRFDLGETTGLDDEVIARFRKLDISTGQTGLGEALERRQPLQVPDILKRESNPLRDAALEAGLRAALIVPLIGGKGPLGALVLQRRQPGEFTEAVVSLMQTFADQSVIALENARLFEEIAQKGRELEIASRHKSQFVANMSHELRTPLAAILGYAELLKEGIYGSLPDKSTPIVGRIQSNGTHLLGLINTVLDLSKIEAGQFSLNMAEYALDGMVENVRVATESLAEGKKLALKTDVIRGLPHGLGDEQRLTQVLLNLVGNAIKFTDVGEVRITASAKGDRFTVAVTDTGPGIPAEEQQKIFQEFHQVDNSNTKRKGGTGLGLAIAKQIVEMHGGRIWVESSLGQGSTFRMELPVHAKAAEGAA